MRIVLSLLIIALISLSVNVVASEKNNFLDSMMLTDEYKKPDVGKKATQDAKRLLKKEQKNIDIKQDRKLREIIKKQQTESSSGKATAKQDIKRISKLSGAPFGLLWGETYEETLSSGVILTKTEEKDYINSFIATQLPKPLKDARYVVLSFGIENKLWRIIAYGAFIKDKPDASLVLKEYKQFYEMLTKKYGHDEQTYIPKITEITKTVDLGKGKTKEEKEKIEEPIGNPNFLAQLQSGEADLYASFYNHEVGAVLSVNVDGDGNSYLILEYKNLKLFQARQNETLDAL